MDEVEVGVGPRFLTQVSPVLRTDLRIQVLRHGPDTPLHLAAGGNFIGQQWPDANAIKTARQAAGGFEPVGQLVLPLAPGIAAENFH